MKKAFLAAALLLVAVSFAAAAPLLVTDSGISVGSADNQIGERKSSWDAAQTDAWIIAWLKIPPGSDQAKGVTRYQYKVSFTSPDKTGIVNEGPFNFPADGIARANKQVSFYDGIKTGFAPQPNEGEWKIEFTIIDKGNGDKEDLGALLPFYLTGNDQNQKVNTIEAGVQKAVDDSSDMAMLAVFNTAKQFGAQQEQQRQTAATAVAVTTTITAASTTTTTTVKKKPAKKKKK
jgi:hypothetical protein